MPKYNVTVERTETYTSTIEVEAESSDDAKKIIEATFRVDYRNQTIMNCKILLTFFASVLITITFYSKIMSLG